MVLTNMQGDLLDWAERPFGFDPVAWDGDQLWALDTESRRICQIGRATQHATR